MVLTVACCFGMGMLALRSRPPAAGQPARRPPPMAVSLIVYTVAQVVSAVMSTSISKMFPRVGGGVLLGLLAGAGLFALINVVSLILAATAVDQAIFVPATVMTTLITNMFTGILVWEECAPRPRVHHCATPESEPWPREPWPLGLG